jgi:hypothetical protein
MVRHGRIEFGQRRQPLLGELVRAEAAAAIAAIPSSPLGVCLLTSSSSAPVARLRLAKTCIKDLVNNLGDIILTYFC